MSLEGIIEHARRFIPSAGTMRNVPAQPMKGLLVIGEASSTSFEATVYEPVLCLILQGSKQVTIADRTLSLRPGECLLVSHDLPVRSRVTRAPYLALVLEVDIARVRDLYSELEGVVFDDDPARAAEVHRADAGLVDALGRYLELAHSPKDAKVLGPLIAKEIHYRILMAPYGAMLRRLIRHDSIASAVARAIGYIRDHLRNPIAIPELARRVGMSTSSFHKHFKTITSTTPLQYQKELRLLEGRRLLKTGSTSVTTVAFDVGYESPSQFSREYSRKFGMPPSREVADVASG